MSFGTWCFAALSAAWSCYSVVSVHDGDTLTVMVEGRRVAIRCAGFDAPELRQSYGDAARCELAALVVDGVDFDPGHPDRYGRVVTSVRTARGEDIALRMVEAGAAWWYRQYARGRTDLKNAESSARSDRRGLWAAPGAVPPWEFRKRVGKPAKTYR